MQVFERIPRAEQTLTRVKGISPMLVELLAGRGVTGEAAVQAFLHPSMAQLHDPFALCDMEAAVRRIQTAIEKNEHICIYGDYDVDGICAVSMLYSCLKALGGELSYYIPSRQDEGYGLNIGAIKELHAKGARLLITVDNGIRANEEAALCYDMGMELIVTDHHLCGETLPRAEAVLCHTRQDDTYPNPYICGAGTAYKLIEALVGREEAQSYLPLAGIATIADVVPLLGENRAFAALALEKINRGECARGILALLRSCKRENAVGAYDISYALAPRLNAAGRLADASLGVELLCEEDEARCKEIAAKLGELNEERQKEEMQICEQAFAMLDASDLSARRTIVLKGAWHSGVIGIAASRIAERYYRPTMLFAEKDGVLTGSARSIAGVHLYAALLQCGDLFSRFGGHAAAAGATMDASRFDAFCARFEEAVRFVAPEPSVFLPRRRYELDAQLSQFDMGLASQLRLLAPFGEGNPEPLFRIDAAHLCNMRQVGKEKGHLNGDVCAGTAAQRFVFFGMGGSMEKLLQMDRCELLCEPFINVWKDKSSLQVKIKALRPCLPEDTRAYVEAHAEKFVDAISRNLLYNDKCVQKGEQLEEADEWLARALDEDITGVLVLCFTPQAAQSLLAKKELCAKMDISFFHEAHDPSAYHALVLAPMLEQMQPWRYKRILVYDTPVSNGILQAIFALAPGAQVFLGSGDASELREALHFDREKLIPLYKALRASKKRFYNREELSDYLARQTSEKRVLCRLGLEIMLELGLAREDRGIAWVEDAPRVTLEKSKTFRSLQQLHGDL